MKKRLFSMVLALVLALGLCTAAASAKTLTSSRTEHIFFYAADSTGKSVLLKVMPLSEVEKLAHGQEDGRNYYISATDNYPTTQYCEAKGFTIPELLDYVKSVTTVKGADKLTFSGGDAMWFMAADSYGNYSRGWTCRELYGEPRYYFEGLYGSRGWKPGWEVGGTDGSKYGMTLETYRAAYQAGDPYYQDKRAVFAGGEQTEVILATESCFGRTTADMLAASTEPGIASYVQANGGVVGGCLGETLSDEAALRLTLPMTEADLMCGHRTAFDNLKWIYSLRLDMEAAPALRSLGTVQAPEASYSLSGDTLTVTLRCATGGASIYYGFEGAAQTLYTGPIRVDVSGRDLAADPLTLYAAAVKEGYDDQGMQVFKYPGAAPAFQTIYSGMAGQALTFTAADGVSTSDWTAWTKALSLVTMKAPGTSGYQTVSKGSYSVNNAKKTVTFDKSLFTDVGTYSFLFHAGKFADKSVSVNMKKAAPALQVQAGLTFGQSIGISFGEPGYSSGLSVYVLGETGGRSMIPTGCLDRTGSGTVSVKPEYFTAAGTAMPEAGTYTLELVNNSYMPAVQTVTVTLGAGFTDVPPDFWCYPYVTALAEAGVVSGMGDGTFAPQGTLNWGQAMKILLLSNGYGEQAPTGAHWASGYLDRAVEEGFIPAGQEPTRPITRLEFCRAAAKVLGAGTTLTAPPFTDTEDPGVLALYERGVINGMTATTFAPDATLNRGQISKIVWGMMNLKKSEA